MAIKEFHVDKLFYAFIISGIIYSVVSVLYISHQVKWTLQPHAAYTIKFFGSSHHFIILEVLSEIWLLFCVIIVKKTCPVSWSELGFKKTGIEKKLTIKLILSFLLIIYISTYSWFYITDLPYDSAELFHDSLYSVGFLYRIIYFIWLILAVPIIEEMFFRGVIFSAIKKLIRLEIALILQAIFFALLHNDLNALFPHIVSGILLGYIFYKSRSLIPSMIAHSFTNLAAIIMYAPSVVA
jgi:membrane protease YdiL (CAAX protease family)